MATKIRVKKEEPTPVKKGDSPKLTKEEASKLRASQAESLERMKRDWPEVTNKGIKTTPKGEHIWYKNEGNKYTGAATADKDFKISASDTLPQKKLTTEEWRQEAIRYANAKK